MKRKNPVAYVYDVISANMMEHAHHLRFKEKALNELWRWRISNHLTMLSLAMAAAADMFEYVWEAYSMLGKHPE